MKLGTTDGCVLSLGAELLVGICEGRAVMVGPRLAVGSVLGRSDTVGTSSMTGISDGAVESPKVEGVRLGLKLGVALELG